jgi:acyl carrier protein
MKLKKSLIKEIKNIFKKELGINVSVNEKIYDHKNWDSLGNFNILLRFEKHFNIKLTSQQFNNVNSFKGMLSIVKRK